MKRSTTLWITVGLLVVLSLALTALLDDIPPSDHRLEAWVYALFFVAISLGSALHVDDAAGATWIVDLGGTAALALAVLTGMPHRMLQLEPLPLTLVAGGALLVGATLARRLAHPDAPRGVTWVAPRILVVAGVAWLLRGPDGTLPPTDAEPGSAGPAVAVLGLVAALYVALVVEAPVRALVGPRVEAYTRRLVAEVRRSLSIGIVPVSTAVLIAVAMPLIGPLALPLFMLPLAFNQLAIGRHEELRRHSRQSVEALSAMPEAMGLVREGHAERVAHLSVLLGRRLGMGRADLDVLERAALLHDVGQVSLTRAVPYGCTIVAATVDQEEIAAEGADIVLATGVLDAEAEIIRHQAAPYAHHVSHRRSLPVGSRVLKVANAVDDLLTGAGAGLPLADADAALERLYLGLGHEYDPKVIEALSHVLRDGVSLTAIDGGLMAAS